MQTTFEESLELSSAVSTPFQSANGDDSLRLVCSLAIRARNETTGILPLLDIFRAWHNLCYQDKQGLTAAQRLEVTDAPLTIKQLLS